MNDLTKQLEAFFEAKFCADEGLIEGVEMHFESSGLRHYIRFFRESSRLSIQVDIHEYGGSFPTIEMACECRFIKERTATGVGPVLLIYASAEKNPEHLRLCITRAGTKFSLSPHWAPFIPFD